MKIQYILEIKNDNSDTIKETKTFKSLRQIAQHLDVTYASVHKNFMIHHNQDEKPSKKIGQKIFDSKYNAKLLNGK